jgi:hypothetical protein
MTIFRFRALLGALTFLGSPLQAQEGVRADRILSTASLHERCAASEATEDGRLMIGYCLGAITGIADAAMTLNAVLTGKQTICLSEDVTADEMRLQFLLFVERRPDAMSLPAATVVIAVLQSSYPCKAGN